MLLLKWQGKGNGLQNTACFGHLNVRNCKNCQRPQDKFLVGLVLFILPVLNISASAQVVSPELYPDSLLFYPGPLHVEPGLSLQEQTRRDAGFRVDLKTNFLDAAQQNGGALQGLAASDKHHQQNYVEDLNLTFATSNDWVRFSVRQSQSAYTADADYLRMLASQNKNRNSPGRERFLFHEGAEGTAGLERIDVNVLRSDWLGASVFASHRDVDVYYESLASQKSKDEGPNRQEIPRRKAIFTTSGQRATPFWVISGTASPTEPVDRWLLSISPICVRESAPLPWSWTLRRPRSAGNFSKETSYDNVGGGPPT